MSNNPCISCHFDWKDYCSTEKVNECSRKNNQAIKFYIASRLENAEQVRCLAKILKMWGWEHTYDWTTHGSVQDKGETVIREVAHKEIQGVKNADIVIVLLPGGRGTHTELGAAIALDKPVFIYAPTDEFFMQDNRTCAFYWNDNITRVTGCMFNLHVALFSFFTKLPVINTSKE